MNNDIKKLIDDYVENTYSVSDSYDDLVVDGLREYLGDIAQDITDEDLYSEMSNCLTEMKANYTDYINEAEKDKSFSELFRESLENMKEEELENHMVIGEYYSNDDDDNDKYISDCEDILDKYDLGKYYNEGKIKTSKDIIKIVEDMLNSAEHFAYTNYDEDIFDKIDSICYDFDKDGKVIYDNEEINDLEVLTNIIDEDLFIELKNSIIDNLKDYLYNEEEPSYDDYPYDLD